MFYFGFCFLIFLLFGFIRRRRGDTIKEITNDPISEMMASFGLHDLQKDQLLSINKAFRTKLRMESDSMSMRRRPSNPPPEPYFAWVR